MISIRDRRLRILPFIYRSLIICIIFLGLLIIGGTIVKLVSSNNPPANKQEGILWKDSEGQTFTGLGRIRVSTADPQPGIVLLFVSFIYYPDDKAFAEELVLRVKDFRDIITNYIGSFTVSELQLQSEDSLKIELLRRFNAILRLGQIDKLFFSDFIII